MKEKLFENSRMSGKNFKIYLEFVKAIKDGKNVLIQGVDYVVMNRSYFDLLVKEKKEKQEWPKFMDEASEVDKKTWDLLRNRLLLPPN